MYQPIRMPSEHVMQFQRWQIYSNFLYLTLSYIHGAYQWSGPRGPGYYQNFSSQYRFSAYAPDLTAPLDFSSNASTSIDSVFSLPSLSPAAVADIIFDPDDPQVTWGGPLITLRITVPDAYFQADFSVKLSAYTDPTRLDGRVRQI